MSTITRDHSTGLERIDIDSDPARTQLYLYGAHVTAFQPRTAMHPLLWLSKSSLFQPGKAIRGGVPICFPWFGPKADDPAAAAHGFARTREWTLESLETIDERVIAKLKLDAGDLVARHAITIDETLSLRFAVENRGASPVSYEAALHSYFSVGDIRRVEVVGLEEAEFLDRLKPGARYRQDDRPITFAAETDRTYVNTESTVTIVDPVLNRRIVNRKSNARSAIVWNPWIDKAKAMKDFGDDEWQGMLCIETANVGENAITLPPGGMHEMGAEISCEAF